jgi:hypothetical protein
MGFDAVFFARIDYEDFNKRLEEKTMEWVWIPSYETFGSEVNILAHTLYNGYSEPPGFGFDILGGDDPWINDK